MKKDSRKPAILLVLLFAIAIWGGVKLAPEQHTYAAVVDPTDMQPDELFRVVLVDENEMPLSGAAFSITYKKVDWEYNENSGDWEQVEDSVTREMTSESQDSNIFSVFSDDNIPYDVEYTSDDIYLERYKYFITIEETTAPKGYEKIEPFSLEYALECYSASDGSETVVVKNPDYSEIGCVKDFEVTRKAGSGFTVITIQHKKPTPEYDIAISKISAEDKTPLAGAELEITGTRVGGEVIEPIGITSKAETVTVKLQAGEYTLTEKTAPTGYNKADPVSFTVADDGTLTVNGTKAEAVVMEDPKTPDNTDDTPPGGDDPPATDPPKGDDPTPTDTPSGDDPTPTPTDTPSGDDPTPADTPKADTSIGKGSPATGDAQKPVVWGFLCAAAFSALLMVFRKSAK